MKSVTAEKIRALADFVETDDESHPKETREVEGQIWWLTADHTDDSDDVDEMAERIGPAATIDHLWGMAWRMREDASPIKRYLSSIDAVLALKTIRLSGVGGFELIELDGGGAQADVGDYTVTARSPVRALLSAVLRTYADSLDE